MEREVMTNMNSKNKKSHLSQGFTLIELIVVIVIIGILAAITIVSYSGAKTKASDTSVLSDIEGMNALQENYSTFSNVAGGRAYYSGSGPDAALSFTPSSGNVIDVVTNGTDYCIRGYNPSGTKNSIYNSFTKESTPGVCSTLGPSATAIANYTGPKVWLQISVGNSSTCGIASDNQAYCWGYGSYGLLGNNGNTDSWVPVAVNNSGAFNGKTIKSVSVGNLSSCAIASDNQAYCWGYNGRGTLGNNSNTDSWVAVPVYTSGALSGKTIKSISTGYSTYATCAVASDNQAYCWGDSFYGSLGNGSGGKTLVPVSVDTSGVLSGKTIKSISNGGLSACVIASDNQAYCWGYNGLGQLGDNTTTQRYSPVAVYTGGALSGKTITSISVGNSSTCAIASDNQAYCWGNNSNGQLGNNSTTNSLTPFPVSNSGVLSGKTIKSISVGITSVCAVASDNQAYCWGQNGNGEFGNNTTAQSNVPVPVNTSGALSGKTIQSVSIGGNGASVCALTSDYQAYCWGSNYYGELGNNSNNNKLVPAITQSAP